MLFRNIFAIHSLVENASSEPRGGGYEQVIEDRTRQYIENARWYDVMIS